MEIQAPCFYMPCEIAGTLVYQYLVVGTVPQHMKRTTLSVRVKAERCCKTNKMKVTLAGFKSLLEGVSSTPPKDAKASTRTECPKCPTKKQPNLGC